MKYSILSVIMSTTLLACGASSAQGNYGGYQATANQHLNTSEAKTLTYMKEEEKIARDIYVTFYQQWNNRVFDKISGSEQRHMNALAQQLVMNNLPDPDTNDAVGVFSNPKLASLYNSLINKGQGSELQALQVAAYVEELDIRDLEKVIAESSSSQLNQTYKNLLRGSHNHLRAFVRQITSYFNITYNAQLLPQSQVDSILNSNHERGNHGNGMGNGKHDGMEHGMGRGMAWGLL